MSGKNKVTRSVRAASLFESAQAVVSSSVSINQGDLVVWDLTNKVLKKPSQEQEGAQFLGAMRETISSGKLARPYSTDVDASAAISDVPGPQYGIIHKCVLKTSDTINPGDVVYLDPASGTRNVSVSGTKAIGIYQGAAITSAAAGTEVEILLGCRYPNDTLKF